MRSRIRNGLAVLFLSLNVAAPVAAEPVEDGVAAFNRGDYATALNLIRPLADQGNAEAQFLVGSMYYEGLGVAQDYAEAAAWSRRAADQGNANAQLSLGSMYDDGRGVPQDYAEAVKWYRKAADQGNASAQFLVGSVYYLGQGVAKDHAEAVKWYRKAADQGNAYAQNHLGDMYGRGQGVPQDYVQAHKWLNLAAANYPTSDTRSRSEAVKIRERIEAKMNPAQLAEAQKLAREWKPTKVAKSFGSVARPSVDRRANPQIEPFKFNYGSIPFGETVETVLARAAGAIATEEEASIDVVSDYEVLGPYLADGTYARPATLTSRAYLHSRLIKKYRLKSEAWKGIGSVDLYFSQQADSFRLLLVAKWLRPTEDRPYEAVFDAALDAIKEQVGAQPSVSKATWRDSSDWQYKDVRIPALVALWDLTDQRIFLLTRSALAPPGMGNLSSVAPTIVYMHKPGWQAYVAACAAEEAKKQLKQKKKMKGNF